MTVIPLHQPDWAKKVRRAIHDFGTFAYQDGGNHKLTARTHTAQKEVEDCFEAALRQIALLENEIERLKRERA